MRIRLLSGLLAAALAVPIGVVGLAQPAQANAYCGDGFICHIRDLGEMALVMSAVSAERPLTPDELLQMTLDITGAVDSAEAEIITHLDELAAYPWMAEAVHAVLEFDDIERFSEDTLQDWTIDVTGFALQATGAFKTVWSRKTANDLGIAMHTLYPIALTARVHAGFGTAGLRTQYREAMQAILTKLEPRCAAVGGDLDPHPSVYLVEHHCDAPDGRLVILRDYQVNGEWREGPYTAEQLKLEAGRGTSWDGARMILQAMGQ